jgi:hypothetical protein
VSNIGMKRFLIAYALAFAAVPLLNPQNAVKPEKRVEWQSIDQLCGQLDLVTPIEKNLVVEGKHEKVSYVGHLEYADLGLYPVTSEDEKCCKAPPIAATKSGGHGAFAFDGVKKGSYWLRVAKGKSLYIVPLIVTKNFNSQTCHDSSVGRSVVLDSQPPKVEIRIR